MKNTLFSTPLWRELNFIGAMDLSALQDKIIELNTSGAKDKPRTVINGWRLNNPHRLREFKGFTSKLTNHCKNILQDEIKQTIQSITFTSWLNVIYDKGYNRPHHHGTCLMSGVFYIIVPSGSGNISFKDPRPGSSFYNDPDIAPLGCETKNIEISPKPGLLLMFPGYLEHFVEPSCIKNDSELRASLAFNVNVNE